jgi:hypothetical protein
MIQNAELNIGQKLKKFASNNAVGMISSMIGLAVTGVAANMNSTSQRYLKSGATAFGGLAQGFGTMAMQGFTIPGIVMGALTALPSVIEAVGIAVETTEEKIQRLSDAATESSNKKLIA